MVDIMPNSELIHRNHQCHRHKDAEGYLIISTGTQLELLHLSGFPEYQQHHWEPGQTGVFNHGRGSRYVQGINLLLDFINQYRSLKRQSIESSYH